MSVPTGRAAAVRRARPVTVDVRAALNLVGTLTKYLGFAALVPAGVALWYGDRVWPFLVTTVVVSGTAWAVERATAAHGTIGAREGFLVVALTWLAAAVFGALPYLLYGNPQLDRPMDAFFEAMSGFTTTGASVLTDYETVPTSLLFWRQFTQWLGGMGIIVLALAVLPRLRVGGRQLLEQELPGPELEPLTSRISQTARQLWFLYIGDDVRAGGRARLLWVDGNRRSDEPLQRGQPRIQHACRPAASRPSRGRSRASPPPRSGRSPWA